MILVLRYIKTYGLSHETLAMVSVVQREWAAKNPRATFKAPIIVEDVLNSRMIAYPFRLLQCCLVTDGGGVLILVAAVRARDFPQKPVYLLGTGESVETPMVSQMEDFTSSRAFRVAGPEAFAEAGITHNDVDAPLPDIRLRLMDGFDHLSRAQLKSGSADIGVIVYDLDSVLEDVDCRPFAIEQLCLVGSTSPAIPPGPVHLMQIAGLPLILPNGQNLLRRRLELAFRRAHLSPDIIEVDSLSVIHPVTAGSLRRPARRAAVPCPDG